jgi:uncharacterized protein
MSEVSNDSRNTTVLMFVLSIFFWFLPALVMFFIKKDDAFVYEHAVELLNMAICLFAAYVVLAFIPIVGWLLMIPLGLAALVTLIMGTFKVKDGVSYRFPFIFRLLK